MYVALYSCDRTNSRILTQQGTHLMGERNYEGIQVKPPRTAKLKARPTEAEVLGDKPGARQVMPHLLPPKVAHLSEVPPAQDNPQS